MRYMIGIDIGGTFTDCAILDENGGVSPGKSLTTPDDRSRGFFDAITVAAEGMGLTLEHVLSQTSYMFHGTTAGTNAMIERRGAKAGLITTKGTGDNLLVMRGHGCSAGVPIEQLTHLSSHYYPSPIIPRSLIEEVTERVDSKGQVVLPLNEQEVEAAVQRLLDKGAQAIAVCFLWSFVNPDHEKRVREIVQRMAPEIYVTISSELVPKWGEYERAAAVAVNSYIGPVMAKYIDNLVNRANKLGYQRPILFMTCSGGVVTHDEAARSAVLTIDSGPVGGSIGSLSLAKSIGEENVICTDMGGTSFDVAIIAGGRAITAPTTVLAQYEYFVPKVDIRSVGAGGGSIVWVDEVSNTLKVGPRSAGAMPGPVCYGRGGLEPATTDADLTLGYLNGDYFLKGRLKLDKEGAAAALGKIGKRLGMDLYEVADGVTRIVDFRMADLIRQMTIQKGYDPRDFTIFAYGGAGAVHAAVYSKELGAKRVIVPRGNLCSIWSAFGAASSDLLHVYEVGDIQQAPFKFARLNEQFAKMEDGACTTLRAEGIDDKQIELSRFLFMRYTLQVHQVEIEVPGGKYDAADMEKIMEAFERKYVALYGEGAGFRSAGIEYVGLKLEARGRIPKPALPRADKLRKKPDSAAKGQMRDVYWREYSSVRATPAFWGDKLVAGNTIDGPAIIDFHDTTAVIRPEQVASIDAFGNLVVDI
jgi:N-methylhydantoinase A